MKLAVISICLAFALTSCKYRNSTAMEQPESYTEDIISEEIEEPLQEESLEDKIKTFLTDDYLKDDIPIMSPTDRKYQFVQVDLNDDDVDEIVIRFITPYFCGTGGCTFLLLKPSLELINKFTITKAPIYVEPTTENNWNILMVKSGDEFKLLTYEPENMSYPTNPSMAPTSMKEPSQGAVVLFGENENAITHDF